MRNGVLRFGVSVLSLVGIFGATGAASASDSPVSVALDFTYASQYYWRGAYAGHGSFAMPSADVSYTSGDLVVGANLWYAQGMEADEADDNNELDYTVYAGLDAGPLSISVGAVNYLIPLDAPFKEGRSTVEVFAAASLVDLPFDNSIQFSINVDGETDSLGADVNSWYLNPSVGYTRDDLTFGLSVGIAGSSPDYYGNVDTAIVDITPSVSYALPVSEDTDAAVSLSIGYNPDAKVTVPYLTLGIGWDGF